MDVAPTWGGRRGPDPGLAPGAQGRLLGQGFQRQDGYGEMLGSGGQGAVERDQPCAVLGADRQMHRIAGAQSRLMVVDETGCCAEVRACNRQYNEAFFDKVSECCETIGPMLRQDLCRSQLQGLSAGELGDGPVANP